MKTNTRLRLDFNNKIRTLYIKDSCEYCGSKEQLELNHLGKQFSTMLNDTLDTLKLTYYLEWGDYTYDEQELIRDVMLGKQLQCTYNTLCKECHTKYHREYENDFTKLQQYFYNKKIKSEKERQTYNNEVLIPYLESVVGKRLLKNDKNELINKINIRVNGKQRRSYSKLNDGLKMLNLPYVIIIKKSNDTRYWLIESTSTSNT